ncbi:ribonuclease Z [Chondromyces apiculatus]|uniref:Ribonuclease Z n=1 Tax=Chondromyces apiculatus DSM 436 TaxID=1192034 RepID=A0A017TIJ0_9BACT|nr:ribonuclease Z [Chondromyces apiculatus]EYF08446.1 Ribonuclease Z [Chondromyces apiculatus DSM 436]
MSLRLTFLGTSAAAPTARRNLSGLFVRREGASMLFDCGEGTQRQMIRYGTGFALDAVFFTHFHADHYLGIIGFLRTLSMMGRTEPLRLYGPPPAASFLPQVIHLGVEELGLAVEVVEISSGTAFAGDGYRVEAFPTDHRVRSIGYALVEDPRPGHFDVNAARAQGVPQGPLFGKLQRGDAVTLADGRVVHPAQVVGPARAGRRVVISGDTRPCGATIAAAQGADLLVHEATFGDAEQERAEYTKHTTAREAARVAREAGVGRLMLTHLSTRYDHEPEVLLRQAREEIDACEVAEDGLVVDLPFKE